MTMRDADEFMRLRRSDDPDDYRRAATEDAPMHVWLAIVEEHPEMRFWVAQNKSIPIEVLRLLARDPDVRVRSMVASKRKLDADTARLLASDSDDGVRMATARNPATPADVLSRLADDSWDAVREVARRRLRDIAGP